ncbi:MAG: hypothetical protein K8S87_03305 [Planctomycetes bacterium]|nr:hypothetical protein [Planctomycetota bacterium]
MKYLILAVLVVVSVLSIQLFAGSKESAEEKLKAIKLDVDYKDMLLEEVFADISAKTGVSIIVDPKCPEDFNYEFIEISLSMKNVSAYDLLLEIAEQAELRVVFKYGITLIVTPEQYYKGRNVIKIYDTRDINMEIRDFPGFKIRLKGNEPKYDPGLDWQPPPPIYEPFTPYYLDDYITEFVETDSWDDNYSATVYEFVGMLIVRQVPEVHLEIAKFLRELRQAR